MSPEALKLRQVSISARDIDSGQNGRSGADVSATVPEPVPLGYRPHLDGLRAIAILAVLLSHFLPMDHPVRVLFPWAELGVLLFFTLSGYLITGILLEARARVDRGGSTRWLSWRQFYARRALRIFPLFYLSIVLLGIAGLGRIRETWPWHVFYLSNVGIMLNETGFGHSTHFWTLAVEEQFYLIWPFLILLLPRRYMLLTLIGVTLAGPVYRFGMAFMPVPYLAREVLLPASLDGLAGGALLAWLQRQPRLAGVMKLITRAGLWLGVPAFALLVLIGDTSRIGSAMWVVGLRTVVAAISVWAIDRAARGLHGAPAAILGSAPMVYIGQISYGLYVWHHFMPDILGHIGVTLPENVWLRCAALFAASMAVASTSYFAFEKPMLRLKKYFPYG